MSVKIERQEGNYIIGNFDKNASVKISFLSSNTTLVIAPNVELRNCRIIAGRDSLIVIGYGCKLADTTIRLENGCKVLIGAYSRISKSRLHASERCSISIGKECLFKGAKFRTSDAHSILSVTGENRLNPAKNIEIGQKVFIGHDVQVLKGVNIGHHSYIHSAALVSRSFKPKSLIAGVPAELLKSDIIWKV